ncbi:MAG: type I restriction endonuclease subunit S [Alcanivorax sp.]|jgi:type I restriction enzyme S subunit|uniref:restriction endonuclease subunit S n=1 Tax=Alcanivorax TaxID=59753 RepID=UPI000C6C30D6|nr:MULTISPECIES: restriction endonuclease subunit S [Alcanivorax]MAC13878.1 type I restriction endonuclease subunit S [Alcanivorax sp.]MBG32581.1 type I restriction endonuclease subunit S [Alcanivorax sp.]MDF1637801.1 restriction endonuclease subunit S [Alcanivorax jadensis]|tara:strand:- start:8215 stop:9579 length:1365 start_codon:yes stop_codon:yes gene_type:complete
MSFPRYDSYVDSGLEWLGLVPSHWKVKRLGHFFEERREKVSDKDFAPLSVTMKGIVPRLETAAKTQDGDNRKKVLEGDFVINSRSDRKGSSGVAPRDGSVSLICIVARPKGIEPYFAHHLLRSVPFQEEFYRYGKGIVADLWSTGYSEMKNIVIPVPPSPEQQKIAAFLDHETAKIDALIAEQQRLIELLKEKRQAVISHAVTKGLNPNAPMKDSGVEWLGEVPAHWMLWKLSHALKKSPRNGLSPPLAEDEGGVPTFSIAAIRDGKVSIKGNLKFAQVSSAEAHSFFLNNEDILIVRGNGNIKMVGRAGIVEELPRGKVIYPDILIRIVPNKKLYDPSFLVMLINSEVARRQIEDMARTANGTYKISNEDVRFLKLPIPPLSEQKEISAFVGSSIMQLTKLLGEASRHIGLLKERRAATISAAVTGKIDVRGWQPSESTSPEPILKAAEEAAS